MGIDKEGFLVVKEALERAQPDTSAQIQNERPAEKLQPKHPQHHKPKHHHKQQSERISDKQYEQFAEEGLNKAEKYTNRMRHKFAESINKLSALALQAHEEFGVPLSTETLTVFERAKETGLEASESDIQLSNALKEIAWAISRAIAKDINLRDPQAAEEAANPFAKPHEDRPAKGASYYEIVSEAIEIRDSGIGQESLAKLIKRVPGLKNPIVKWDEFIAQIENAKQLRRFVGPDVFGLYPDKSETIHHKHGKPFKVVPQPGSKEQATHAQAERERHYLESAKNYGMPLVIRVQNEGHTSDVPIRLILAPRYEMDKDTNMKILNGREWVEIKAIYAMGTRKVDGQSVEVASKQNFPASLLVAGQEIHSPMEIPTPMVDAIKDPANKDKTAHQGLTREKLYEQLLNHAKFYGPKFFEDRLQSGESRPIRRG